MDTLDHDELKPASLGDAFSDLVTVKLDSCHSTWYFQPVRMRFRRELKGIGIPGVSTEWRPYYGLRFDDDSDGFTVFLNREGTRLLTSWCHPPGSDVCANCYELTEPVGIGATVPPEPDRVPDAPRSLPPLQP